MLYALSKCKTHLTFIKVGLVMLIVKRKNLSLFFGVFLISFAQSVSAELEVIPDQKNAVFEVFITGKITEDDHEKLARFVIKAVVGADIHASQLRLLAKLNSTGGSIKSAMNIGRLLRETDSFAVVPQASKCFSACVYILAGAKRRAVDGEVGVHRPYEAEPRLESDVDQKAAYKSLELNIKNYLSEVNIPSRLYDDSIFISPEKIKILEEKELEGYGLNRNDPFVEEADAVQLARKLGISRSELAARYAYANSTCNWDGNYAESSINKLVDCRRKIVESSKR